MRQLLEHHVAILDELRDRQILRSANNPTGDLAEYLFCRAFGWQLEPNSTKAFDALAPEGRMQIKGRRLHSANGSRQLSAIRDLNGFDFLAAVLFEHDYAVHKAIILPARALHNQCRWSQHTNSHKFHLRDEVWRWEGARDVTAELQSVEA